MDQASETILALQPVTFHYKHDLDPNVNEFLKEHRRVEKLEAALRAVTARLAEQDARIQKVSAQIEANKSLPQIVLTGQ